MHGQRNIKFCIAKQAQQIYKYKNVSAYLHLAIWRLPVHTRMIKSQSVLHPVKANIKLRSSGKRRSVVWLIDMFANVSQECEPCIFREEASTWGEGVPPKHWYVSTKLRSFATEKTAALANEKCLEFCFLALFSLHFLPQTQNARRHNRLYGSYLHAVFR